jgi:hypothetical protein
LDPRGAYLIRLQGFHSRSANEALARVFHQGPGYRPNMTGCSNAVLHLLTRTRTALQHINKEPHLSLRLTGKPL